MKICPPFRKEPRKLISHVLVISKSQICPSTLWLHVCRHFLSLTLRFLMAPWVQPGIWREELSAPESPTHKRGFCKWGRKKGPLGDCHLLLNCRSSLYILQINLLPDMTCKYFHLIHVLPSLFCFVLLVNFSWHTMWLLFPVYNIVIEQTYMLCSTLHHAAPICHNATPLKYHWVYFLCCTFHPCILFIP